MSDLRAPVVEGETLCCRPAEAKMPILFAAEPGFSATPQRRRRTAHRVVVEAGAAQAAAIQQAAEALDDLGRVRLLPSVDPLTARPARRIRSDIDTMGLLFREAPAVGQHATLDDGLPALRR